MPECRTATGRGPAKWAVDDDDGDEDEACHGSLLFVFEAEAEAAEADDAASDRILAEGPRADPGKGRAAPLIALSDDESELGSDEDSDEDVILEAGPALIIKHDAEPLVPSKPGDRQDLL